MPEMRNANMCRLFGMHSGTEPVDATFWLVGAADSLEEQSRHNPDGFGIGAFDRGVPTLDKRPTPAWRDPEFARAAHTIHGTSFVAHVRHASTGALTAANTHPFLQHDRMFAHNGVVRGLDVIDARLAELGASDLVAGETDSERVFALCTAEIGIAAGDVRAGLEAALRWITASVPVYSLNFVLITATDLWALRYPDDNTLFVLERPAGRSLRAKGSQLLTASTPLADRPSVLVASEALDGEDGWSEVEPGTLVHVDRALTVTRDLLLREPPVHRLMAADLGAQAASQTAAAG